MIQQTGYYGVAFSVTVAPLKNASFPVSLTLSMRLQGTDVPGAAAIQLLHNSQEAENVALTQIIRVTAVPATLNIIGSGSGFLYSTATVSVLRIGDIS